MTEKIVFPTVGQRVADIVSAIIRSWAFIICQMLFIAAWIIVNHHFPTIAFDNKSFDILRLVLTIESSFIGSVLLMAQHRQSEKDRKIIYSDYILDRQIYKEVKEMHPLIDEIHKKTQDK